MLSFGIVVLVLGLGAGAFVIPILSVYGLDWIADIRERADSERQRRIEAKKTPLPTEDPLADIRAKRREYRQDALDAWDKAFEGLLPDEDRNVYVLPAPQHKHAVDRMRRHWQ